MSDQPLKDIKILYAEDELDLYELFSDFLKEMGAVVDGAEGGEKALELVQSSHYDLIITDIRMPLGDGLALLKNVRSGGYTMPILCVTGFSDCTESELMTMGANGLIRKPCSLDELLEKVVSILELASDAKDRSFAV